MSPPTRLLCAAIAMGYFTIPGHAVEPDAAPTSDRLASTLTNLEGECFRAAWLGDISNAFVDLGRPKPLVGAWFHNPEAQPLVAAIIAFSLIYGGTSVISRGLPVTSTWILKGTTTKVIGIILLLLGILMTILFVGVLLRGNGGVPNEDNPWSNTVNPF